MLLETVPPPPELSQNEQEMARVLGATPASDGIQQAQFDTPIIVNMETNVSQRSIAKARAEAVRENSAIVTAINSGEEQKLKLFH